MNFPLCFFQRRANARNQGETNDGYNQEQQTPGQPLVIQLKPPPYEKGRSFR